MPIKELYCPKCNKLIERILITESDKKHFDTDTHFCDTCGGEIKPTMSVPSKGKVK